MYWWRWTSPKTALVDSYRGTIKKWNYHGTSCSIMDLSWTITVMGLSINLRVDLLWLPHYPCLHNQVSFAIPTCPFGNSLRCPEVWMNWRCWKAGTVRNFADICSKLIAFLRATHVSFGGAKDYKTLQQNIDNPLDASLPPWVLHVPGCKQQAHSWINYPGLLCKLPMRLSSFLLAGPFQSKGSTKTAMISDDILGPTGNDHHHDILRTCHR